MLSNNLKHKAIDDLRDKPSKPSKLIQREVSNDVSTSTTDAISAVI